MDLPRADELTFGVPAMAFAAGLAIAIALAYDWLSTVRQRGSDSLQITRTGAGPRPGGYGLREPLIALQVTLALTLMVGSLLMVQTYRNLSRSELGFRPDRLLVMEVGLASRRYTETRRIYGSDVIERSWARSCSWLLSSRCCWVSLASTAASPTALPDVRARSRSGWRLAQAGWKSSAWVLVASAAALVLSSLGAALLAARRAAHISPGSVLRGD